MDSKEMTLTSREVYDGRVVRLREDTARLPDGKSAYREVIVHPGGVGVALEDEDGTFFMVSQWRYAQEQVTLEFPAGKREPGEDAFVTGQREIVEETGYEGKDWRYLGKMFPTPAYDTEVIELYYARKGAYRGQHLDADEHLNLRKCTLDELTQMILDGEIPDAKTICMVMLLRERKARGEI